MCICGAKTHTGSWRRERDICGRIQGWRRTKSGNDPRCRGKGMWSIIVSETGCCYIRTNKRENVCWSYYSIGSEWDRGQENPWPELRSFYYDPRTILGHKTSGGITLATGKCWSWSRCSHTRTNILRKPCWESHSARDNWPWGGHNPWFGTRRRQTYAVLAIRGHWRIQGPVSSIWGH